MGQTLVCVRSSVHVNPTQDFNEWAEYTFNQVKQNYKSKIKSDDRPPIPINPEGQRGATKDS